MSDAETSKKIKRPSRGGRWLRRIAIVLLVCITAGLLFYNLFIPTIAKNVATGILEDLGFKDVDLDVHAVSTSGLYASNLREGSDQFRIGAIGVNYNVSDLLDGRIETITLIGVEWEMQIRDGKITIAPFDALPKSADDEPAGELPFKTIRLQSSVVGIDWDGYKLRVPVDATITNEGDRQFSVAMNLDVFGTPLQIKGSLKPEKDEHGHELLAVAADIRYLKTPWSVNGKINPEDQTIDIDVKLAGEPKAGESPEQNSIGVDVAFHRYSTGHSIELDIWTRQKDWQLALLGDTAKASTLEAQLSLSINEELKITELLANFESPDVSWNDMTLRDVVISLDQRDGMLNGLAQASGDQWTTNIKADAPSISELLAGVKGHDINASWQLDGRIPHWIADQMARFGYRIEQREDAHFSGRATAHLHPRTTDEPATVNTGDADAKAPSWRIVSDDITLAVGDCDLQPSDGSFKLKALAGELKFEAEVSPKSMQWRLKPDSKLAFAQASFGAASPITVGANSFLFAPESANDQSKPANQMTRDAATGSWHGVAFVGLNDPLKIKNGTVDATIAQLSANAVIGSNAADASPNADNPADSKPVPVALTFAFDQSSFSESSSELAIKNISATLPIGFNDATTGPGRFSLSDISYKKQALAPIQGTANLVDGMIRATANWKPLTDAVVNLKSTIDLKKGGPDGSITFSIPNFAWTTADQQLLATFLPAIGDLKFGGALAVKGEITLIAGELRPNIEVIAQQLSMRSEKFDVAATGVNGSITINGFNPVSTPGRQNLHVQEFNFGNIKLIDGAIAYRMENPDSIFIERAKCSWGEKGTFFVHAFRLKPSDPEFDLELFVENLELQNWIAILSAKRVTGTGRVYGRVPIAIRPAEKNPITAGRGVLYVIPVPKQPGDDPRLGNTLQFHDSEFLRQILISSDPRFETDPNMKETLDTIVEAMKDFKYDRLTFDFVPRPEHKDLQLRIITSGEGFKESNGTKVKAPIDNLTVNLNVENEAIRRALLYKRGSEKSVKSALEDFFKN